MLIDHASGVATPKTDHVFLHVRSGMTVIVEDDGDWRMADMIWVDGGTRKRRFRPCFRWPMSTPASIIG